MGFIYSIKRFIERTLKIAIIRFKDNRKELFAIEKKINSKTKILMNYVDMFNVSNYATASMIKEGDFCEVGVYKGGSAILLAELLKGRKNLYLFDKFDYIPVEEVRKMMQEYPNITIYPGLFPDTSDPIKDKKFAFVHIDVNIYEPTLACLEFFYPRIVKGGILLCHDYFGHEYPGVKKAFDEFFKDKPELVLETLGSHCLMVKT